MMFQETLNMPAGREMDALIAREIFGMTIDRTFKGEWVVNPSYYIGSLGESRARGWAPKPYSTDIAAAWEVLEAVSKKYECATVVGREYPYGRMMYAAALVGGNLRYDNPYLRLSALADTAPLAICRAALIAVAEAS
jgi:hypothetical protein